MTNAVLESFVTDDDRRSFVQTTAVRNYRRRAILSNTFLVSIGVTLVIAFIPLASILFSVISHGWHYITWNFLTTPQQQPDLFHKDNIGGVSNAITGTLLIDGLALLLAIPFSMILSIALFESKGRMMSFLRSYVEIMVGLPSILLGIFIYTFVVTPMDFQLTAFAGILALSVLMIPLMTVACEQALVGVPATLTEAALALGARPSRVMLRVLVPYALPRMLTGIMLSLSRAVGETAPILFIIGTSLVTNWNPLSPATTLPTLTYNYLGSQYSTLRDACWGMALILITTVFALNLISRIIVARSDKGRN